jgi:hypothetical protein
MTIEESMADYGLDPRDKIDLAEYARMLRDGELMFGVPEELQGDAVSGNGLCEWSCKKAFANKVFHDVSFETVSKLFEGERPGYRVLFGDIDSQGSWRASSWGEDVRDFIVARIGGNSFYVVKVDREHTVSGRVRLVTAFRLKSEDVLRLMRGRDGILSSVDVRWLVSRNRAVNPPVYAGPVRRHFLAGYITVDEAVDWLVSGYQMGEMEALDWLTGWVSDSVKKLK